MLQHGGDGDAAEAGIERSADTEPEQPILAAHNELRARHCAPPLTWSKDLAAHAQRWATTLKKNSCAFDHNPSTQYGENLAFFAPPDSQTPASVAKGWYDEVRAYNFSKPGFSMTTGHFTQLVWRNTTAIGCGSAQCNGGLVWVCNYDPPGNFSEQYATQVLPDTCSKR